jgi:hypothetical protein
MRGEDDGEGRRVPENFQSWCGCQGGKGNRTVSYFGDAAAQSEWSSGGSLVGQQWNMDANDPHRVGAEMRTCTIFMIMKRLNGNF